MTDRVGSKLSSKAILFFFFFERKRKHKAGENLGGLRRKENDQVHIEWDLQLRSSADPMNCLVGGFLLTKPAVCLSSLHVYRHLELADDVHAEGSTYLGR